MTGSNDSFLQEIRANPEDSTSRLIYADWLEEQGDPVAELIRVQCELDELSADSDETEELRQRERALIEEYRERWIAPLEKHNIRGIQIRRGFIEAIRMDAETFIAKAEEIVSLIPALCSLNLRKSKKWMTELAQVPELEHVRFLDLRLAGLQDQDIRILLDSPYLTNLVDLNLQGNNLTGNGAELLAKCEKLATLQTLNIAANSIESPGLQAFGESTVLNSLKQLIAWRCGIAAAGLRAFSEASGLPQLEVLDLSGNEMGRSISGFKVQSRPLRTLKLSRSIYSAASARTLAATPGLNQLKQLDIDGCNISGTGLSDLLSSPHLTQVERLRFSDVTHENYRRDGSETRLPAAFVFSSLLNLQSLDLRNNRIGDQAITKIAKAGCLANVVELNLNRTRIGDRGLRSILDIAPRRLQVLDIGHTNVTSQCLHDLAAWPGLPSLTMLTLNRADLDDKAARTAFSNAARSPALQIIVADMFHTEQRARQRTDDVGRWLQSLSPEAGR